MKEISIVDVGPIKHLRIPLPQGGGLTVLRARNGAGKSEALNAVNALVGNADIKCGVRRGANGSGCVDGLGATITVGKRTRRTGDELEVRSLSSDYDLSQIVDPGIADPLRADAIRIKALVSAAGITPTREEYVETVGDSELFDAIGSGVSLDDPISAVAHLKKNAEKLAREYEQSAATLTGEVQSLGQANAGIDLSGEHDEKLLASRYEIAVQQLAEAEQQVRNAAIARSKAAAARESLAVAEADPGALSVEEATLLIHQNQVLVESSSAREQNLIAQLSECRVELAARRANLESSQNALKSAETRDATLAAWRETIASAENVACPSESELQTLRDGKGICQQSQHEGVLIREAIKRESQIAAKRESLATALSCAETMRQSAANVENVLTDAVQRSGVAGLSVKGGRLLVSKDDEFVAFAELSDGERWHLALEVGIERVGESGLIVIPQYAYGEIDPINQLAIDEHARRRGVHVLTAEATADDELHAESFS